jgi:hypothetical protein
MGIKKPNRTQEKYKSCQGAPQWVIPKYSNHQQDKKRLNEMNPTTLCNTLANGKKHQKNTIKYKE